MQMGRVVGSSGLDSTRCTLGHRRSREMRKKEGGERGVVAGGKKGQVLGSREEIQWFGKYVLTRWGVSSDGGVLFASSVVGSRQIREEWR